MDVLVDIDGTLADGTHRERFLKEDPPNWDSFFAACGMDSCIEPIAHIVRLLYRDPNVRVVFSTGRPERIRAETTDWLYKWLETPHIDMIMRTDGDTRSNTVVKAEQLLTLRAHGYKPQLAIEDNAEAVAMYRAEGILVFQCAEGKHYARS